MAPPIPSVFRGTGSASVYDDETDLGRPATLAELSKRATSGAHASGVQTVDSNIPISRYLIGSETLTRQAETCLKHGDVEGAFIALVKVCKLLIETLPYQHEGYKKLDATTKKKMKEKGQQNLDMLSKVKLKVVDRFEAWRKANPDVPLDKERADSSSSSSSTSQRASLRPVPSTGVMENGPVPPRASSSSSASSSSTPSRSIEYVKPESAHTGFDVRDILGQGRGVGSSGNSGSSRGSQYAHTTSGGVSMPSPFTSSPLQPFSHSHSSSRNPRSAGGGGGSTNPSFNYPTLRPANSVRMNQHQGTQGFAPRSQQTYSYYQIQTSDKRTSSSSSSTKPPVSMPEPHTAPYRSLPQQPSLFNYPSVQRMNQSYSSVEEEAKNLLHLQQMPSPSSTFSNPSSSPAHHPTVQGTTTEGGEPLRTLLIPASLITTFVRIAEQNTRANIETCALLMGTIEVNMLQVNHLLIPKQTASSDRCDTQDEEGIWSFMESKGLVTLGWCHTHPQQSCFMSSLDLHTHSAYQATLPEAIAIVCAPNDEPSFGLFRLTSPFGLKTILSCRRPGLFHPHVTDAGDDIEAIYTDAVNGHVILVDAPLAVTDLR